MRITGKSKMTGSWIFGWDKHTKLEIFAEKDPPLRVNRPEACGLRHLVFRVESVEKTVKELAEMGNKYEPIRTDSSTEE